MPYPHLSTSISLSFRFSLLVITIAIMLGSCQTHQPSESPPYVFEWDMLAENHTGKTKDLYVEDGKHRGMSAFHWSRDNYDYINQLVKNNIENVALVPFMYQHTDTTKVLRSRRKMVGNWGRRDSSFMQVIDELHGRGIYVFYKPHIWMSEGWRSTIAMDSDEEWDTWFASYREHMIHHAMLAAEKEVEMFCIGTELRSSIIRQPHKWNELVDEIRTIYKGKLTYAANWDGEYNDVLFWDKMDFIGIQAYYPLTNNSLPTLAQIENGWRKHIKELEGLAKKHNKKILFTETGYRSDQDATIKPWEWGTYQDTTGLMVSNETQMYAYEGLFRSFWDKEWFAGLYFWQWHNRHGEQYKVNNVDFTPRFKPAENVMAQWFGK